MTALEFKGLYDKLLNSGEMSIGEYRKLCSDIDSIVETALVTAYDNFSIFVRETYDIDYDFSPRKFLGVSIHNSTEDEMCIGYGDRDSVSFVRISVGLISSWVEGDFTDLIDKSYASIKSSLEKDIANCKRTIQTLTSEIDSAKKILDEIAMNESNEGTIDDKAKMLDKYWDFIDNYAI